MPLVVPSGEQDVQTQVGHADVRRLLRHICNVASRSREKGRRGLEVGNILLVDGSVTEFWSDSYPEC